MSLCVCVCAPVYVLTQGVCAYVYALAQESCGKSRFLGPSMVLILRSGQENLYSEADGLLSHVDFVWLLYFWVAFIFEECLKPHAVLVLWLLSFLSQVKQ